VAVAFAAHAVFGTPLHRVDAVVVLLEKEHDGHEAPGGRRAFVPRSCTRKRHAKRAVAAPSCGIRIRCRCKDTNAGTCSVNSFEFASSLELPRSLNPVRIVRGRFRSCSLQALARNESLVSSCRGCWTRTAGTRTKEVARSSVDPQRRRDVQVCCVAWSCFVRNQDLHRLEGRSALRLLEERKVSMAEMRSKCWDLREHVEDLHVDVEDQKARLKRNDIASPLVDRHVLSHASFGLLFRTDVLFVRVARASLPFLRKLRVYRSREHVFSRCSRVARWVSSAWEGRPSLFRTRPKAGFEPEPFPFEPDA